MSDEHPDTYSTQWESPTQTGGEWRHVVGHESHSIAWQALRKLVDQRKHCRIVAHREGQEDYTVDERGPFNGPIRAEDRR
jgi:hypothetical protein